MASDEVGVRVRLRERRKFSADARKVREDVKGMGDETRKADKKSKGLGAAIGDLSGVVKLVKPAALIAGVGALAQVAGAATVGVLGLVAGIAPAVGALAAVGNAGIAAAQGVGVAKLAFAGMGDAVGGLNEGLDPEKLALLTPAAQGFAKTLNSLKPEIVGLQKSAQAGLFPGMEAGLKGLAPLLTTLKPIVNGTGVAIGGLAANAGRMFGGSAWRDGIASMGATNIKVINNLGWAALHLATAFMRILVAAGPLTVWLSKMVLGWAQSANMATSTAEKTSKLAAFFEKTREVLVHLFSIVGAVGSAFLGLMRAAYPVGSSLLALLDQNAEAMAKWVNSATGQNAIAAYFAKMKPVIIEVARLARDVVKAFFEISNTSGALPLVQALRTKLLPAFTDVIKTATAQLGPALTDLVVSFGQLIAVTSGANGPLALYVRTLTLATKAAVWLLTTVPGLSQMVTVIALAAAAWKVYKVIAAAATAVHFLLTNAMLLTRAQLLLLNIQQGISAIRTRAATGFMVLQVVALNAINFATRIWAAGIMLARTAMLWLNIALLANPIGAVIIAIIAVGAAFVLAYNKIGWFRDGVNAVWSWIKSNWPLLLAILTGPIGLAVLAIIRNWDRIKQATSSVVGFVKSKFGSLLGFMRELPGKIAAIGVGLWDGLKGGLVGILNWAIDKINWLIRKANKLPFVNIKEVGHIGGDAKPKPPGMARGGPVPGTGIKDTVLRLLTPGEHVLTRGDVAAAGGQSGVMSLRRGLHTPGAATHRPRVRRGASTNPPAVQPWPENPFGDGPTEVVVNLDGKEIARNTTKHANDRKARK